MTTHRVLKLYEVKSDLKRRALISATFIPLFLVNLALHVMAVVVLCGRNQGELFRSAAHYWRTSERIADESQPNAKQEG